MIFALRRSALTLVFLLAPLCGIADPPGNAAETWVLGWFARAKPGETLDKMRQRVLYAAILRDHDGDGLSLRDNEIGRQMARAKGVGSRVQRFLGHDLDSDGVLTLSEVELGTRPTQRLPIALTTITAAREQAYREAAAVLAESEAKSLLAADTDGDNRITLAEMLANAQAVAIVPTNELEAYTLDDAVVTAFDLDHDGTATAEEIDAVVRRTLAAYDADGDGHFASEELEAAKTAAGQR